jgi:SAM-dependent methyltransferase
MRFAAAEPEALARAVESLFAASARRPDETSAAARERFSWRATADAHLRLYEEVREARDTVTRIGLARYDLATLEKLPVVKRLLGSHDGPPAEPCLDVGVGTGFQTFRALGGAFTVALDAWRPNLDVFRSGLSEGGRRSTAPLQASADRLPFADGTIATVLCSEVLEHLEDDHGALGEIARVLKPGGSAVLTVPSMFYGFDAYMHLVGMKTVHDFPGPERHVRLGYTEAELRERLARVGLEIEEVAYLFRPFTKLAMELVSVAHIAYQRLVHGRRSWSWSDAEAAEGGLAFRVYRTMFPALRAVAALDKIVPLPGGFGLAVRARKPGPRPGSGHEQM